MGRASKQAQESLALQAQVPALGSLQVRAQAPMEVGGLCDETLRVSTEGQTSVRTCCYDLMRKQN